MPAEHNVQIYGTSVLICAPDGLPLDTDGAAAELIGEAIGQRAEVVVIPTERLTDDFFELSTGIAGGIAQKFTNYRIKLAVIGDIAHRVDASTSLRAWVTESNDGQQVWFYPTFDEFKVRL